MTARSDILRWLKAAPKGSTHMLVVCDTFDYEDYPVYVNPDEDVNEIARKNDGPNMTRLMEVYSFSKKYTIEGQLDGTRRTFNFD